MYKTNLKYWLREPKVGAIYRIDGYDYIVQEVDHIKQVAYLKWYQPRLEG